jgi:hypothetical protein
VPQAPRLERSGPQTIGPLPRCRASPTRLSSRTRRSPARTQLDARPVELHEYGAGREAARSRGPPRAPRCLLGRDPFRPQLGHLEPGRVTQPHQVPSFRGHLTGAASPRRPAAVSATATTSSPNDPGQVKSCTPPPDPVGSNAWGMVPEGVHILRRRVGRTGVCARSPRRPTAAADGPVSAMRWDAGCAVLGSTRRAGVEEGDAARRRRGRWSRDGPAPRTPSLLRRPTPPTRLGSSVSSRCGRR